MARSFASVASMSAFPAVLFLPRRLSLSQLCDDYLTFRLGLSEHCCHGGRNLGKRR